jgi:hypothetical protein
MVNATSTEVQRDFGAYREFHGDCDQAISKPE